MDDMIERRLTAALGRRRDQRPFVADLIEAWRTFVANFDQAVASLDVVGQAAHSGLARSDHDARIRDDVVHLENTFGDAGLASIRARVAAAGAAIDAVHQRVNRDTVNIGVVGMTKAGKSALLRTITELDASTIPSEEFDPTTAAASRIYHRAGPPAARVTLHSWETFRDLYLAPLHEQAGLGPVPWSIDAFAGYGYPSGSRNGAVGADRYLEKLRTAQTSLDDYRHLLTGGEYDVDLGELRRFVAYPRAGGAEPHCYHAVRVAHIYQQFQNLAVSRLGLIDLPGRGEAGLDVERAFIQPLRTEVDELVMVKRPDVNSAFLTEEDWRTVELADEASGGVPLEQFMTVLVNRDRKNVDPAYVDQAARTIREEAVRRGIRVVDADVLDRAEVFREVLEPVLDHLAHNLAEMDRASVRAALDQADQIREEIARFADRLAGTASAWQHEMPDADDELHAAVMRLYWELSHDLLQLRDRYDSFVVTPEATIELERGIVEAVAAARTWVANGLGRGSRDEWLAMMKGRFAAGDPEARMDEFNRARAAIGEIFLQIDASASDSVARLWRDVAEVLRGRLSTTIVPEGTKALEVALGLASERRARTISGAIAELLKLDLQYGSIVLRVARPIIRRIHWDHATTASESQAMHVLEEAGAAMLHGAATVGTADAPAALLGVPIVPEGPWNPPSEPASERHEWWTNPPRSPAAAETPTPPGVGAVPGRSEPIAAGIDALYEELTQVVEACVVELDAALRTEARVMGLVLAAAADQFFDSVVRRNDIELEYKKLCQPHQQELWPDLFQGGNALLGAEISISAENARVLAKSADTLAQLSAALRLRAPSLHLD